MVPFIKKIRTKNNLYIYDVNTNSILKVDETVFNIIDDIYDLSPETILAKWQNQFNEVRMINSINNIKNIIKKKGVFSHFRPKGIKHPFSTEKIKNKLENELMNLHLEVTQQCNMRCFYCCYSGKFAYMRKHNSTYMSFNVAKKAIDFFLNHSNNSRRKYISFYGGEPLLAFPLIYKCVKYANKRSKEKIYYGLTTNGTILNDNIIKFLQENDFFVTVSLDGPAKIHDRYRRFLSGRKTYNLVINNVKKFHQLNKNSSSPKLNLNIAISPPYKLKEIRKYIDSTVIENGFSIYPFFVNADESNLFSKNEKRGFNEDLVAQRSDLKNEFKTLLIGKKVDCSPFLKKLFSTNFRIFYNRGSFRKLSDYYYPNGVCIPGWEKLFIDAKGEFYICEKMTDFYSIGNIHHGMNFKMIFRILDDYCNLSTQDCINCWAIRFCKACYDHANRKRMLSLETKRRKCAIIKNNIEEDLKFYLEILEENQDAFDYLKNEIIYDNREKKMIDIANQEEVEAYNGIA